MGHRTIVFSTVLAMVLATPLTAQSACPDNFTGQGQIAEGGALTCQCSAQQAAAGSVWGSDRYTADSSMCRAALHAGVIGEGGGRVSAFAGGACAKFVGTSRHGVPSANWGAYERTFSFRRGAPCAGMEKSNDLPACPSNATGLGERSPACGYECFCPADASTGSVWGSELYTTDSSICGAARHAGAVPATGGAVAVFAAGHCESFKGSSRNGVSTSDWGPYGTTFAFRYPPPACADGAAPRR